MLARARRTTPPLRGSGVPPGLRRGESLVEEGGDDEDGGDEGCEPQVERRGFDVRCEAAEAARGRLLLHLCVLLGRLGQPAIQRVAERLQRRQPLVQLRKLLRELRVDARRLNERVRRRSERRGPLGKQLAQPPQGPRVLSGRGGGAAAGLGEACKPLGSGLGGLGRGPLGGLHRL